jgi:hypothetical protein
LSEDKGDRQLGWNGEGGSMKKLTFIFGIFFSILTFIGAAYVLYNEGGVSAGYAVVPMMFALACTALYRQRREL